MEIEQVNQSYYDRLYLHKSSLARWLHPMVSYDQQSKSKRNFLLLAPFLKAAGRAGKSLRILDYGFGHGSFLLKIGGGHRAYGCELSREAIRSLESLTRANGKPMTLFLSEELSAQPPALKFDFIVCSHVLEHVPDDRAVLLDFTARLSEIGGVILNLPINEVWVDPKHHRGYTRESVESLLASCGLKAERFWICDRWTAFILGRETSENPGRPLRLVLKGLRLALGIAPLRLVDAIEKLLPVKYREQQLLVLAFRS